MQKIHIIETPSPHLPPNFSIHNAFSLLISTSNNSERYTSCLRRASSVGHLHHRCRWTDNYVIYLPPSHPHPALHGRKILFEKILRRFTVCDFLSLSLSSSAFLFFLSLFFVFVFLTAGNQRRGGILASNNIGVKSVYTETTKEVPFSISVRSYKGKQPRSIIRRIK